MGDISGVWRGRRDRVRLGGASAVLGAAGAEIGAGPGRGLGGAADLADGSLSVGSRCGARGPETGGGPACRVSLRWRMGAVEGLLGSWTRGGPTVLGSPSESARG